MSYTLSIWQSPSADALPADRGAADAQLAEQRARGRTGAHNPRFLALAEALHERFPPAEDQGENEVWVDGSEDGQTDEAVFSFGLLGRRFFTPAYLHAVAQCRRLGLNLHDPQSGDHFLADGRGLLGDGKTEAALSLADNLWEAETAWRQVDWATALADWRRAAARGSQDALHELGRVTRLGLSGPPMHQVGTALMVLAGVDLPAFEQARSAAYGALAPGLQRELPELLGRLRAAPDLLAGIDAELATEQIRRAAVAPWPWDARGWSPERLTALWRLAADGMAEAAERLAQALETTPDRVAELGGPAVGDAPAMAAQLRMMAAQAGAPEAQVVLAQRLLVGEAGWALDPAGALLWLRRAHLAGRPGLDKAVPQLASRLAKGWDAAEARSRAVAMMPGPPEQTVHSRMARLRRACELDLPEAWREMGHAHLAGIQGLPLDPVVGAALILFSHKQLSTSSHTLPAWVRAQLPPLHDSVVDEALHLCRRLVGAADPWALIHQAPARLQPPGGGSAGPDSEPPWARTAPGGPSLGAGLASGFGHDRQAPDRARAPGALADWSGSALPEPAPWDRPPSAATPGTPEQTVRADTRQNGAPSVAGGAGGAGWAGGADSASRAGFASTRSGEPSAAPAAPRAPANLALPPTRHPPKAAPPPAPPRPAAPGKPAPSLPGSLCLLWLGAAGAVLWLGRTGQLSPGGRLALVLLGACAAAGAWGCATHLGRGLLGRVLAAASAAVPLLGLLQAGALSLALWRRRGGGDLP